MANRRFIDFPIATTVGDSDIILIWQSGVNKQTTKATFLSGLPENLDELNDVAISGLTNGQILRYDSVTGKWENTDQGNLDLNDLNDVSIVSPSNGQVLVYNSSTSKWENSSGGFVPYTGAVTTVNLGAQTIQAGQFVKAGGTSSQFLKADGSIDSTAYGTGSVTSVGLTMPSAFSVANSPITSAGTLAVTGAGTVAQYIRGDGSLADFPEASGGGSSISYYLNGSVNQGTIGGVAYKELNKVPILGAGTDFSINANGYIASFITDAGDPNLLEIPGGNWNFETYFSASSGGGSPTFYVELYKVSGTTATLIASNSSAPELIAFGTNITAYFSSLAVPTTTLALTDRLAVRYYVTHSGRTITMHTENNHLCQIITTFTTGLTALNGLTAQVQNFAVGTTGTDFNIASATATHTFNLPTASATNRGALSSSDWTTFNNKQNALTNPVTGTGAAGRVAYWNGSGTITSDSLFQWNDFSKRLGIGRTPTVSLDVEGAGFFSGTVTASSIIKSGGTSSQYLMADGSVSTLTNPVTGTGTTNYLPKFTGTSTIGNSQIFDNGTNVGIGTASVSGTYEKLAVAGGISIKDNTNAKLEIGRYNTTGAQNSYIKLGANSNSLRFTNNTDIADLMELTNSGNLGLGVTPSAWDSVNTRAFQLDGGSVYMYGGDRVFLGQNIFFGALGDTYVKSNFATTYRQYNGTHAWYNAPSGTAGNAISFTQAMTLTSGGNVGIGTTSPLTRLMVQDSGNTYVGHFSGLNQVNGVAIGTNSLNVAVIQGYTRTFSATNNIAMQTDGGNVLIGTTTDNGARLQVSGVIRSNDTYGFAIGSIASYRRIQYGSDNATSFTLLTDGNAYAGLYAGAATFSSSVAANGLYANAGNSARFYRSANDYYWGINNDSNNFLNFGTFAANGTAYGTNPKLLIQDNGNVLIGTTTDNGARLQVSGTATFSSTGNAVRISSTSTASNVQLYITNNNNGDIYAGVSASDGSSVFTGTTAYSGYIGTNLNVPFYIATNGIARMAITSGGNVGIGTASPSVILELGLGNLSNSTNNQFLRVNAGGYNQASSASLDLFNWSNNFGQPLGWRLTSTTEGVGISLGRALTFNTVVTDGGGGISTATERMRITSGGNVGIGTASPVYTLDVRGRIYAGTSLLIGESGSGYSTIESTGGNGIWLRPNGISSPSGMFLTTGGNVLIGTTTDPGARLHVNGDIRTAAPSGGSAVNWKLGTARGGTITPNAIVRVEIGGVLVDLDARYV